jgi:hypothetical protein
VVLLGAICFFAFFSGGGTGRGGDSFLREDAFKLSHRSERLGKGLRSVSRPEGNGIGVDIVSDAQQSPNIDAMVTEQEKPERTTDDEMLKVTGRSKNGPVSRSKQPPPEDFEEPKEKSEDVVRDPLADAAAVDHKLNKEEEPDNEKDEDQKTETDVDGKETQKEKSAKEVSKKEASKDTESETEQKEADMAQEPADEGKAEAAPDSDGKESEKTETSKGTIEKETEKKEIGTPKESVDKETEEAKVEDSDGKESEKVETSNDTEKETEKKEAGTSQEPADKAKEEVEVAVAPNQNVPPDSVVDEAVKADAIETTTALLSTLKNESNETTQTNITEAASNTSILAAAMAANGTTGISSSADTDTKSNNTKGSDIDLAKQNTINGTDTKSAPRPDGSKPETASKATESSLHGPPNKNETERWPQPLGNTAKTTTSDQDTDKKEEVVKDKDVEKEKEEPKAKVEGVNQTGDLPPLHGPANKGDEDKGLSEETADMKLQPLHNADKSKKKVEDFEQAELEIFEPINNKSEDKEDSETAKGDEEITKAAKEQAEAAKQPVEHEQMDLDEDAAKTEKAKDLETDGTDQSDVTGKKDGDAKVQGADNKQKTTEETPAKQETKKDDNVATEDKKTSKLETDEKVNEEAQKDEAATKKDVEKEEQVTIVAPEEKADSKKDSIATEM